MVEIENVVNRVLRHAYDPVKAHEYYIRTRELKGRQPGAQTPDGEKTSSSKSNATSTKSSTQKGATNPDQARIDKLHREIDGKLADIENGMKANGDDLKSASKTRTEKKRVEMAQIAATRKTKLDKIAAKRKADLDKIENDRDNEDLRLQREHYAKVQALPPIPKGIGILEYRRRSAERAEKLAKINKDFKDARFQNNAKAAAAKGEVVATAVSLRDAAVGEAKTLQQKVKDKYPPVGKQAKAKGGEIVNAEYDKLKKDLARLLGRDS